MANELRHTDVGAALSEAEYDSLTAHQFESQATGDLAYASSATQLSRLAIDTTAYALTVVGGIPAWAILTVPGGGTGVATLNDGGVLIGGGAGVVKATAVLADGEIIVGDGTTDPVLESGATARTSLGLAIGTDVQAWDAFLDDIAALTDPGADRVLFWDDTAGDIVFLTMGTGLAIAGTTLNAHVELARADQAALEGETDETTYVSPDLVKNSPGVAKAWCTITAAGVIESPSYNISGVVDTGTGDRAVSFGTDFSSGVFVPVAALDESANDDFINFLSFLAGSVRLTILNGAGSLVDTRTSQAFFGDQ